LSGQIIRLPIIISGNLFGGGPKNNPNSRGLLTRQKNKKRKIVLILIPQILEINNFKIIFPKSIQ
jgi:hypothetical protein